MILRPTSRDDLSAALAAANKSGDRIDGYDLSSLSAILRHTPEDMTVSVEAGATLKALQSRLREGGQWLPIDPPHSEKLSIGALLAGNPSGPRRLAYGTIREHLIGIQVALADGRVIKAGGNVVKNVAGYDLCKLFVGSRGALGCIVEANFKLRPLAEVEQFFLADCETLDEVESLLERTLKSPVEPVALDLVGKTESQPTFGAILGFAGSRAEVEWQKRQAMELGFSRETDLSYETEFWSSGNVGGIHTASILPSRLIKTLKELKVAQFVARAGSGILHYRGGAPLPAPDPPRKLLKRMKDAYDPNGILPDPQW